MAVAPENFRAAHLAVPRLPLSAILALWFLGIGGSIFVACTTFSHGEEKHFVAASNDSHVYSARAVPFDSAREDPAQRAASIARALSATSSDVRPATDGRLDFRSEKSKSTLVAQSEQELRGFNRLASFDGASNYLALTGANFGMSAQTAPSGVMAPDAVTAGSAVVPEASTWLCGGALLVLVAARGARAHWHRKRRREH